MLSKNMQLDKSHFPGWSMQTMRTIDFGGQFETSVNGAFELRSSLRLERYGTVGGQGKRRGWVRGSGLSTE